jgi:hypothetical protein
MELFVYMVKKGYFELQLHLAKIMLLLKYLFTLLIFKWHFSNHFDNIVTSILVILEI